MSKLTLVSVSFRRKSFAFFVYLEDGKSISEEEIWKIIGSRPGDGCTYTVG
jgi:hypothetical protein